MIVGIDEVGRGPWAGPLVVGAVVLGEVQIEGLTDSKKLSAKKRKALAPEIYEKAQAVGLGWVSASELDKLGMSGALTLACKRALEEICIPYHQIVLDGTVNFLRDTSKGPYVTTLKQADLLVPSVSAASIVAKVARDAFMSEMAELYPGYGFEKHVGYGTAAHRQAIEANGLTSLHRMSFAPIRAFANQPQPPHHTVVRQSVSSRDIGNQSEDAATDYLITNGYRIVARNWKTRVCEIDIVAEKAAKVYFCEVKHRKSERQGSGLEAITPKKYHQMLFAARVFAHYHDLVSTDLQLVAMATTGIPPVVTDFIEI